MSAIRGCGFALGTAYLYGPIFGVTFGTLSTVGQVVAYQAGIRPTLDYQPAARARLTKHQFLAAVNRTFGYAATGYFSAWLASVPDALRVGVKTGLATGVVTGCAIVFTSFVEWTTDRLPAKTMGVFGIVLILIGFALQSLQYWAALLDVVIR
jgi:multidrug transporter EmrE-like cation transporter